jgi:ABC-type multidrug transport system fused ATPase/permease subunit
MVKSNLLFIFLFLFSLTFVSAEYSQIGENNLQFTCTVNYQVPSPSAIYNLSVYYPNGTSLIQNVQAESQGQGSFNYTLNFSTEGLYKIKSFCYDTSGNFSGEDFIEVTLSGQQRNTTVIVADIFLILLISTLIFILHRKYRNVKDSEKSEKKNKNKDLAESHNGNWGRTFIKTLGSNLMRNSFLWYYSLGWLLLIVTKELIYNFNSVEIYNFFVLFLNIYSFGFFLVIIVWIGILINHFQIITEIINDLNLGVHE